MWVVTSYSESNEFGIYVFLYRLLSEYSTENYTIQQLLAYFVPVKFMVIQKNGRIKSSYETWFVCGEKTEQNDGEKKLITAHCRPTTQNGRSTE